MSQWKNIAPVIALSISAALAGTGCLAQQGTEDEATTDAEATAAQPAPDAAAPTAGEEKTGETKQACFGGCGCGAILGFGGIFSDYACFPGGFFGGFPPFGFGLGCGGCGGGCGGFGGGFGGCGGCF